jgi:hypothetical protein
MSTRGSQRPGCPAAKRGRVRQIGRMCSACIAKKVIFHRSTPVRETRGSGHDKRTPSWVILSFPLKSLIPLFLLSAIRSCPFPCSPIFQPLSDPQEFSKVGPTCLSVDKQGKCPSLVQHQRVLPTPHHNRVRTSSNHHARE